MKHLLVSFSFITFFWFLVPTTVQATEVNVLDKANLVLVQTDNRELSLWIEPSEYANFAYTFANSTYRYHEQQIAFQKKSMATHHGLVTTVQLRETSFL